MNTLLPIGTVVLPNGKWTVKQNRIPTGKVTRPMVTTIIRSTTGRWAANRLRRDRRKHFNRRRNPRRAWFSDVCWCTVAVLMKKCDFYLWVLRSFSSFSRTLKNRIYNEIISSVCVWACNAIDLKKRRRRRRPGSINTLNRRLIIVEWVTSMKRQT